MKISFSTLPGNLVMEVGYGYAGYNMVTALQRLGHQVPFQDPDAPVQIHFSQPTWYEFDHGDQYKIGYTPWESTELAEGWLEDMNAVDEIWTPSPVMADVFRECGVTVPVSVYEHGVSEDWTAKHRKVTGPLKFLHHGEPAPRKGAQMTLEAFREAFGDSNDVQLIIKSHGAHTVRTFEGRFYPGNGYSGDGMIDRFKNVKAISRMMETDELIAFYQSCHVLVYPSWGEGFGLIPLQGLATGMPVICTEAWAPYKRFLLPELRLASTLSDSPWPEMHPGKMWEPSFEDLVEKFKYAANNYETLASQAYRLSFPVHKQYDWTTLTEKAFSKIVKRFGP